jgi:hypothetical protein
MAVLFGLMLLGAVAVDQSGASNNPEPSALEVASDPQPAPEPVDVTLERRLDCIQWFESKGFPGAYNRASGASGAFQFLRSTWASTPQGRAGLSPFDPVAARAAARWMVQAGRAREWVPVQRGWC